MESPQAAFLLPVNRPQPPMMTQVSEEDCPQSNETVHIIWTIDCLGNPCKGSKPFDCTATLLMTLSYSLNGHKRHESGKLTGRIFKWSFNKIVP
jgi:hypothetical protein